MRAPVMYGAGDIRVENVPDARLIEPTDALVRVTRACICGSDLWPYRTLAHTDTGRRMGHEAIGIVEGVGADVRTIKPGHLVVMPLAFSDGTCVFGHEGLHSHASTEGSSAPVTSTEHRPRRCASRRRTEHSASFRSAKATR
jgi:threonine dehydrogenase-like Zn-dependent dehydrogenase